MSAERTRPGSDRPSTRVGLACVLGIALALTSARADAQGETAQPAAPDLPSGDEASPPVDAEAPGQAQPPEQVEAAAQGEPEEIPEPDAPRAPDEVLETEPLAAPPAQLGPAHRFPISIEFDPGAEPAPARAPTPPPVAAGARVHETRERPPSLQPRAGGPVLRGSAETLPSPAVSVVLPVVSTVGTLLLAPVVVEFNDSAAPPLWFAMLLIAPSTGQMYAGDHGRAWLHSGLRLAMTVGGGMAVALLVASESGSHGHGEVPEGVLVAAAGITLGWLGSSVWSIMDGWQSCTEMQRGERTARAGWRWQPMLGHARQGDSTGWTTGLRMQRAF